MRPQPPESGETGLERTFDAAQAVVDLLQAIDRDPGCDQPGFGGAADPLLGEMQAAGLQRALHAVDRDFADDLDPVPAEVGLTADQGDLARAQTRKLPDEVETLLGREFARPHTPGARAA